MVRFLSFLRAKHHQYLCVAGSYLYHIISYHIVIVMILTAVLTGMFDIKYSYTSKHITFIFEVYHNHRRVGEPSLVPKQRYKKKTSLSVDQSSMCSTPIPISGMTSQGELTTTRPSARNYPLPAILCAGTNGVGGCLWRNLQIFGGVMLLSSVQCPGGAVQTLTR